MNSFKIGDSVVLLDTYTFTIERVLYSDYHPVLYTLVEIPGHFDERFLRKLTKLEIALK